MINEATIQLLNEFEISWTDFVVADMSQIDVILAFGGGNMGPWYSNERNMRRDALKLEKPIIVLPQSFHDFEPLQYARVYVRETESLKYCPNAVLAPDLALGYRYDGEVPEIIDDLKVFLRRDGTESIFGHLVNKNERDPAYNAKTAQQYINLVCKYKHIVTDRLHIAVCGLLLGRRVTLLPVSYHKNRSMWETWLRDLGCEWADKPEDFLNESI